MSDFLASVFTGLAVLVPLAVFLAVAYFFPWVALVWGAVLFLWAVGTAVREG